MELGVKIGADVPYCVVGGTALAEGIGEKLTPLAPAPDCYVLVAKPDINVSTKYVYEHLDAQEIRHLHLPESLLRVLLLERNDFAAIRCTILGSCGIGIGNIFGDHVHTQSLSCQSGCRNIKC